ncbi:MAG: RNA polymerase recycling motor HelD [Liquorilactobacillus nagelii]|jgi:DNA helicase-2/ATP-dependent DNA helicase PcrA|uniref:ATP-dependent DNA helicase n=1 Tax=Liquorilactobacillus nagelii TaxID=82688 RepID=A0A3Q8CBF6_9LACO|nr:RNA polymerase recycling motor HelD [Liquorilactobacillus nagelii]AUJ31250.1 ATP-dependent DNA helicase [Liquorilactobacillus nagelii]MCC7616189.1 ATP-dependent DNA helicase [Liquorilactobacillus nagelii]MCP9314987.1 AAA family ATPase [Liquorilactobacillus nagelii]
MAAEIKQQEQQYMNQVVTKIKIAEKENQQKIDQVKHDAQQLQQDFPHNLRLKTETYTGMMETAMTVRQQQQLLTERENDWQHAERRLDILTKMEKKPYFARIDFQESTAAKVETIYIGLGSFADRPDNFLIYDWRAPISSIYYEGHLGDVSYQTPGGTQTVNVTLKRQFLVANGKILTVFDTDETVGDQMLLEALGENADTKMKSIVTTIQQEQNKIIRDTKAKLLFVQGAAGSGKTSAVLQRAAFLLYRFRGSLTSSQLVLFSPNQLFNDYIAQVLPDLGEQRMVQLTYYQYAQHRLPRFQIETLQQRFERKVTPTEATVTRLKSSLIFHQATLDYAAYLEKQGMAFRDIMSGKQIIFSKAQIAQIYYSFNENYHLRNRLDATKERLLKRLMRKINRAAASDEVQKQLQDASAEQLSALYGDHPRNFQNADQELKFLGKQLVIKSFRQVQRQIKRNHFINITAQYYRFLKNLPKILELEKAGLTLTDWQAAVADYKARTKHGQLLLEDATPYLQLYDLITGKRGDTEIKQVFIDEIQDYTPYQLAFIQQNFPRARFTLLGDLNQAIFTKNASYTLLNELNKLFPADQTKVVQLTKSYRSTKQITEFSRQLLLDGAAIQPFDRNGDLPTIYTATSQTLLLKQAVKQLQVNQQADLTTAIICRTLNQCQQLTQQLQQAGQSVTLIKTENQRLAAGTIIVPAFLAKGLEFDAVIFWNANAQEYAKDDQRQLVYTICSRAMHRLTIMAKGELSPLFARVDADTYRLTLLD